MRTSENSVLLGTGINGRGPWLISPVKFALLAALDHEHLDVVGQCTVGGNQAIARAVRPVGKVGRDYEPPLSAWFHAPHALFPAFYDLAVVEYELMRFASIQRRAELSAVFEPARVVKDDALAWLGRGTVAHSQVSVLEARGGRDHLLSYLSAG